LERNHQQTGGCRPTVWAAAPGLTFEVDAIGGLSGTRQPRSRFRPCLASKSRPHFPFGSTAASRQAGSCLPHAAESPRQVAGLSAGVAADVQEQAPRPPLTTRIRHSGPKSAEGNYPGNGGSISSEENISDGFSLTQDPCCFRCCLPIHPPITALVICPLLRARA
jgi:hypothetical protein